MTTTPMTQEEIKNQFVYGDAPLACCVCLASLAVLLSEAMTADGVPTSHESALDDLLMPAVLESSASKVIDGDIRQVLPSVTYVCAADWMVAVAERHGYQGESDGIFCSDWLKNTPHTAVVMRAVWQLGLDVVLAASDAYSNENGHSMIDVLFASNESGEGLEQTRARLSPRPAGLRVV